MRSLHVLACIGALLLCGSTAQAQTGRVTGRITQVGAEGAPVSNATIQIVGTGLGALSDAEGRYMIPNVPAGTQRVQVRRLGFAQMEDTIVVTPGATVTKDFEIRPVVVTLQEQVVIGYGTQRRSDITGAVSSVQPNADQVPATSLEQMLQGTAAGVQVTQASSAPGGGISIRIRGGSSVSGNNEPLYVIDGFPIESDATAYSAGDAGRANTIPFNPLASLNPSDIESIEILKDASATAIYGSRGANGVVIVTTKRGQAGAKPRVTVDLQSGMQTVAKRYDLLNATEFALFANEWAAAQTQPDTIFTDAEIAAMGRGTDWQDLIFRSAPVRNLQIGVSGGSSGANATRYALSGGLYDQQGVVIGSDFRRVSLRGNLDQSIGEKFRIFSNLQLSRTDTRSIPTDGGSNQSAGAVGGALQYYPFLPVRRTNGEYTLLNEDSPLALSPTTISNPVSLTNEVQDELGNTRALSNVYGEYTIIPGLRLRVSGGADYSAGTRDTYYPRTTLIGRGVSGEARRGRNDKLNLLNENTLTFERTWGERHAVNAVGGYTRQMETVTRSNITNSNFVSDITTFEDIGAGARLNGPGVGSGRTEWRLVSYLGRVNYTLMDRYIFTATGRRDGSSRFGAESRWAFFPSYSAAWRLSEEPVLRDLRLLDQLKLRWSWGEAGNNAIRPYQSLTRLSPQNYTFNGVTSVGYYPSLLGNPDLGWETSRQTDIGFDLGLWQGRVELTVDRYVKNTRDLLLSRLLPPDVGFGSATVNIGTVDNKGVEAALRVNLIEGEVTTGAFRWTTGLNYARNRNRVTSLDVDSIIPAAQAAPDIGLNGTITQVGKPLGVFYGYKAGGILRDTTAAREYTEAVKPLTGTSWEAGDRTIIDVNGDGVISALDRTIIGNPAPKFTLGWTNNLAWRRFELSTVLDGSYGATLLNLNLARLESGSPRSNLLRETWTDRWTPENPNAGQPRVGGSQLFIGNEIVSDMLEDGSYTRLRAVTFSYTLPAGVVARSGLSMARVYVTGTNLVTWTDYSGFNPDVSSISLGNVNRGIDVGSYPLAKAVTFGVNLSY